MASSLDQTFVTRIMNTAAAVSSKFQHSRTKPPQDESTTFCVHLADDCFLTGTICCDGHSIGGENVALKGVSGLKAHFESKTIDYARLSQQEIIDDITIAFDQVQASMLSSYMQGGSTCYVAWAIVWADGRDTDIHVANIGDSPVFVVTPTEVVRMTTDDSATNKEEAERLMAIPDGMIPVYADRQSNYNSPAVFRRVHRDGMTQLELDMTTPVAIGLKSTTRSGDMPTYWVNQRISCNMVCIAVSRSFGNNDKRRNGMISTPHYQSFRVTPGQQIYVFGCSDGWMDANHEDQIGPIIRSIMSSSATTQDSVTNLMAQGFQAVATWQKELSCGMVHCGRAYPDGFDYTPEQVQVGWDDVTCTMMDVSKWPARAAVCDEPSVTVSLAVSDGDVALSLSVLP